MVSTRGVKFKFSEGEKVLCYEPDPTKAKVLYDSKVLEVIVNKDNRGRKCVEYLIHFQGWNSSWDRCVGEDYVLKDTDDNRRLQRTLSDKAQLQLRERKQQARRRKTSDKTSDGVEEGSNGGVRRKRKRATGSGGERKRGTGGGDEDSSGGDGEEEEDNDNGEGDRREGGGEGFSSGDDDEEEEGEEGGAGEDEEGEDQHADEESNDAEGKVPLSLSDNLKKLLEEDGELITCKNKLIRLPAIPNVVSILESFMKQYALNQFFPATLSPEKRKKQGRNQHSHSNGRGSYRPRDFNKAVRNLNLCKEVVDGIRIYFDHTLSGLLLYRQEKEQYEEDVASLASLGRVAASSKNTPTVNHIKTEPANSDDDDFYHIQIKEEPKSTCGDSDKETAESSEEISSKSFVKEEETQDKNGDEKGNRGFSDKFKETSSDFRDELSKFSKIDGLNDFKPDFISSLSGAINNTMSSAASTSSCCSTPSCLTSSNRPQTNLMTSGLHERAPTSMNSLGITPNECALLRRIMAWKLIPDSAGIVNAPSQLYGAIHLTRLFVKLPDLLHASGIHEKKLKVLLGYLHTFLEFLEEHSDWFGEEHYKENSSSM